MKNRTELTADPMWGESVSAGAKPRSPTSGAPQRMPGGVLLFGTDMRSGDFKETGR